MLSTGAQMPRAEEEKFSKERDVRPNSADPENEEGSVSHEEKENENSG